MACKGICHKHKAIKPYVKMGGRYENGQKRCNMCDIFMNWAGRHCPCCGMSLGTKPRERKSREKFLMSNTIRF